MFKTILQGHDKAFEEIKAFGSIFFASWHLNPLLLSNKGWFLPSCLLIDFSCMYFTYKRIACIFLIFIFKSKHSHIMPCCFNALTWFLSSVYAWKMFVSILKHLMNWLLGHRIVQINKDKLQKFKINYMKNE